MSYPTQEEIDKLNAAGQVYADEKSIPHAVAVARLSNLLVNMVERPLDTEVFISHVSREELEVSADMLAEQAVTQAQQTEHLKTRLLYLEEVIERVVGGDPVDPPEPR